MQLHTYATSLLISFLVLGLGIAGFIDNCDNKVCCESYLSLLKSKVSGSTTCSAEPTFRNSRPLSLQLFMIGLFLVVAVVLTHQSVKIA